VSDSPLWQFKLGRENGLAFWGMIFLEGSFAAYIPIWTLFMEELGAPITTIGLLLSFGGFIRFFVLLPTASLARRFGAKNLLIASRVASLIGIGTAAFAQSWYWLLPAMIGIAIGSMAFPIVLSHVAANANGGRVRAFALVITIGPAIAFGVAPLISSGLIMLFGLRSPFVLSVVFSLISIFIFSRIKAEHTAIEEDREAPKNASYRDALAIAQVRKVLLLKFLTVFALGLGMQLIPNYLRQVGGYPDDLISLLTSVSAIGSIGFGFLVVRNKRFSSAPMRGSAVAIGGVALGYLLLLQPAILPLVVVGFILRGGMFSSISLFSAALGDVTPDRNHHHVFTLSEILIVAGFTLSPVLAGFLYTISPRLPLVLSVAISVPLALYLLRVTLIALNKPEPAKVLT
jgi:MFS family permease